MIKITVDWSDLPRMFGWKKYRLLVIMRWRESPEWVKTSLLISARSRAQAAAKAIVWAQRDTDTGWESVTVENAS